MQVVAAYLINGTPQSFKERGGVANVASPDLKTGKGEQQRQAGKPAEQHLESNPGMAHTELFPSPF